jgi:RNA polymerase sigma factor (TIGR02999 family)
MAGDELSAALYRQLRVLARWRLRGGGRSTTLETTALVHEAFLRMGAMRAGSLERRSLLGYASRTMRSVIVDEARKRQTQRRGGDALVVTWDGQEPTGSAIDSDRIVRVHEALHELAGVDARLAQLVEMRFFAGLSDAEIAQALDVSERTVNRDWAKARLVLAQVLRG